MVSVGQLEADVWTVCSSSTNNITPASSSMDDSWYLSDMFLSVAFSSQHQKSLEQGQ